MTECNQLVTGIWHWLLLYSRQRNIMPNNCETNTLQTGRNCIQLSVISLGLNSLAEMGTRIGKHKSYFT